MWADVELTVTWRETLFLMWAGLQVSNSTLHLVDLTLQSHC